MEFPVHIPFVEMLGFELISCEAGRAEIAMTLRDELTNSYSVAHGGVSMTLLDVAMAHAARSPNQLETEHLDERNVDREFHRSVSLSRA